MPLQVLFDNLMAGMTPEDFLDAYQAEISLEDIAARGRVSKASIYRRGPRRA